MGKRRRTKPCDSHVRFYNWMLTSPAYRSLPVGARALLVELYSLHKGPSNNGWLYLSVREAAERLGVTANTASKWLALLEERGFIRAAQRGAFSQKVKHATRWILTEHEYAGQSGSRDFMRWRPPEIQNPDAAIDTDRRKYCDRWRSPGAQKAQNGISQ